MTDAVTHEQAGGWECAGSNENHSHDDCSAQSAQFERAIENRHIRFPKGQVLRQSMFVDAFVKALGERMLGFKTKKNQASANWRVRARLIDPRKTKLTIIRSDTTDLFDIAYNAQPDREEENAKVPKENQHLWKTETKEDLGIPVSFKPVDD